MLQNAYLLAKIGADTAENERNFAEICQKLATGPAKEGPPPARRPRHAPRAAWAPGPAPGSTPPSNLSNFAKIEFLRICFSSFSFFRAHAIEEALRNCSNKTAKFSAEHVRNV